MEGKTQNQLISKVQYKNFEPGEFTDRRGRTYDETIALIEAFPWSQQRAVIGKELTLSRGNNIFYYGKAGQPQQWDKKNIIAITDLGSSASSRSNYGKLVRIDIRETGSPSAPVRSIYIPSILIRDSALLEKFPAIIPQYQSRMFPFIPSDASSPS